ncbi:hypothetical protein TNCV_3652781 [Trichonephila clavipes]|nr:hypothetical protein TNCV_3652781 [Trichonephila clavipes]
MAVTMSELQPSNPTSNYAPSITNTASPANSESEDHWNKYTTDEEEMIVYDVEEDGFEKKPAEGFVLPESFRKTPHKYVRALTPTPYRKKS